MVKISFWSAMFFYRNFKFKIGHWIKANLVIISVLFLIMPYAPVFASEISEQKIVDLANEDRAKNGINEFTIDPLLHSAAEAKAQNMLEYNYFDHYSPAGRTPWSFIKESGYDYLSAGENLAMDFRTAEGVNNALMASSGHRDNILNPKFQNIGVAVVKGRLEDHATTLVVQMFAQKNYGFLNKVGNIFSKINNFILGI